jgi:hypothetical protein
MRLVLKILWRAFKTVCWDSSEINNCLLLISFGKKSRFKPCLRRKIRLIESNAKCRYLTKLMCKGTLRQVFYLSEAPSSSYDTIPPPLHTVHVYTVLYTYSHREGRGELTKEKVRGAIFHKANRKYQHDRLYLQSVNSIKHQ